VSTFLRVSLWGICLLQPGEPDATLDRLVHNAYRIELTGESMRKRRPLDPAA
jgi:hypothetical protein